MLEADAHLAWTFGCFLSAGEVDTTCMRRRTGPDEHGDVAITGYFAAGYLLDRGVDGAEEGMGLV